MYSDPFTMTYDVLFDLVAKSDEIKRLVRVGNLIKFSDESSRDPLKQNIQVSDLPELVLATNGISSLNTHRTSHTSSLVHGYRWLLSTGDMRVTKALYPVEWALWTALHDWRTALTQLQWPEGSGWHFAKRLDVTGVSDGESDPQRNRGIVGWSAVWTCQVEMHFRTHDLVG